MSRDFTCRKCQTSGDKHWMNKHDCDHNQKVQEFGGRCEDYPCCGHTDGGGCADRPEFHSEHYAGMIEELGWEEYEYRMEMQDTYDNGG